MEVEVIHTFTQSGLGKAPFGIVEPKLHAIEKAGTFWCEHCGTQLKNRYFVKSTCGKVSIVGVDCLKKTGDQGLIEGVKRLKREERAKQREAERIAVQKQRQERERARNGGKSNQELIEEIEAEINSVTRKFIEEKLETNQIIISLTKVGFEQDMQLQAYLVRPYSNGQLNVIKKIATKNRTGARDNSKAYKAAYEEVGKDVDLIQKSIVEAAEKLEALRKKRIILLVG